MAVYLLLEERIDYCGVLSFTISISFGILTFDYDRDSVPILELSHKSEGGC